MSVLRAETAGFVTELHAEDGQSVKKGELLVEISEGVKVRVVAATIAQVINKTDPAN